MGYKYIYKTICTAIFTLFISYAGNAQWINTIAGNGTPGYSGDGGPASAAQLFSPVGVAVDNSGNVYIADELNNCIRMVTTAGIISTVAGTGTSGFSGDGGPATSALLFRPLGVAVDASGNIYIADTYNERVRKVTPAGIISTIAGTGTGGYNGDGIPATTAELNFPTGIAIDPLSHVVYIADFTNDRIRVINSSGIINTFAGGFGGFSGDGGAATAAGFQGTAAMAVSEINYMYIADEGNQRIRKVNTITGDPISTYAGDGTEGYTTDGVPATTSELYNPTGVAVSAPPPGLQPYLYIADEYNNRIRKVDTAGIISTIAGTGVAGYGGDGGPATAAKLNMPQGIAANVNTVFWATNVYISDQGNNRVRIICPHPAVAAVIGGATYCVGETIALSDDSTGGVWSSSNSAIASVGSASGVMDCLSPGTVTIAYQVHNRCGDTASAYTTVVVAPLPQAGAITGIDSICAGDTTTLRDTASGGSWYSSNTSVSTITTSGVLRGVSGGVDSIWYVVVSSTCGTDTAKFHFLVRPLTVCLLGTGNTAPAAPSISVYPNPATSTLYFTFPLSANTAIKLTDITGRTVNEQVLHNATGTSFNVKGYTPGIYLYQVTTDNETQSGKILIE